MTNTTWKDVLPKILTPSFWAEEVHRKASPVQDNVLYSTMNPAWVETISTLFSAPYWIGETRREAVAKHWNEKMTPFGIALDDYTAVKKWSVTIYHHLRSRSMPLTSNTADYWPAEALELLRLWVNQGCRETLNDPFHKREAIAKPEGPVDSPLMVRKDILELNQEELNLYRAALDALKIGDGSSDSPWQKLAYVHTNWCLHYQEAFLPWHRAQVLYLETLIKMPVPYWNFFADGAAVDGHPAAGIPKAFLEDTYIHPVTKKSRPNPLKYAAGKDGINKRGTGLWVERDPLLADPTADPVKRKAKIEKQLLYQRQIVDALTFPLFSAPQGIVGYPWTTIPSLDPPPPDSAYPYRGVNFDGLIEQPHDNYHGWLGPDMADNACASFDPLFWSMHSNFDRIFEMWIRTHRDTQCSNQFWLQPFVGRTRDDLTIAEGDPRFHIYTTIGDMFRDSKSMGYCFATPHFPDVVTPATLKSHAESTKIPRGGSLSKYILCGALTATEAARPGKVPYIMFNGVRCMIESYTIDVYLHRGSMTDATFIYARDHPTNQHYVGALTRLGMGKKDEKSRCIRQGVTRVLRADRNSDWLSLNEGEEVNVVQVVTHLSTGRVLEEAEWQELPGFKGELAWGNRMPRL